MTYTNHSGGAKGSDFAWDRVGREFGITDHRHYWHDGLPKPVLGNVLLTDKELEEGWTRVKLANQTLNRRPEKYKSLLARNWFQVKNSDSVFAIGTLNDLLNQVSGGTGWAVQMAIDSGKPVFVYDDTRGNWYSWTESWPGEPGYFVMCEIPTLTQNFAGIGTRQITMNAVEEIRKVYRKALHLI